MCLLWTTLERGSVREKSTDVVVYNQSSLWILVVIIWVDICCLWHLPSFVVKVQVFCLGEKAALIEILDRFKWPYLSHRVTNHYVPHRWGHWVGVCNFLLFLFFPLPPLPGNNDQEDKNHCTDVCKLIRLGLKLFHLFVRFFQGFSWIRFDLWSYSWSWI